MRPVVRTALVVAGLAAIVQIASWIPGSKAARTQGFGSASSSSALRSRCPPGTLPDGRSCIPVPRGASEHLPTLPPPESPGMLPRRPDRPTAYEKYRWPVELSAEGIVTDDPSAFGSLQIPQRRGAVVRATQLVDQVGDAELLAIDKLVGTTVVTLHTLRHAGGLRKYLVFHGSLAETSPGLKRGANVASQTVIGKVGDAGQPGNVHLYLEVRQLRRSVDPEGLPVAELRHSARSVACDPRNVFPLK